VSTLAAQLGARSYGKHEARVIAFAKGSGTDDVADFTISIMASGGIDECYEAGDNRRVVTSDAQHNRALSVLERSYPAAIEELAVAVVSDLRQAYPYFPEIKVEVLRHSWQRVGPSYLGGPLSSDRASATAHGDVIETRSGLDDLEVLITGGSRFTGFAVDEYTTNQPVPDRPLVGRLDAHWSLVGGARPNWRTVRDGVRTALLVGFGEGRSESVQHLLTLMAAAVLVQQPLMAEISLHLESTGLVPVPGAGPGHPSLFTVTTSPTAVTEVTVHQRTATE
jgi:urate oxidase